jgi:hypothetical protein
VAQTLLTIDMVTKEAMRIAHEKCQFIGTVDRQYDDSYANTGAKIGSALRVRLPNQYVRTQGSRVMDVQEQAETAGTITLATQDHVDMRFNSAELALSIDEVSRRYIEPAMSVLVSGVESDFLAYATKKVYNWAGTAGTAITDLTAPGAARAKLNQFLAPKDGNRYIQMDSTNMGVIINGLRLTVNPSDQTSEAYREGYITRTSMATWYENDRLWSLTNNADIVGTPNATSGVTDGGNQMYMYSTVASAAQVVGSVFTMATVYACHPETKAPYPFLKSFVVTAASTTDTTAATGLTTFDPPIYLTGPKQNVCTKAGAKMLASDFGTNMTFAFEGVASASYVQPLMYHKEAFQFVTADLPIMDDAAKCVRMTQDGLSLRVWQASDIRNDELLMRIDMLYGFAALRPEWACRIIGSATA